MGRHRMCFAFLAMLPLLGGCSGAPIGYTMGDFGRVRPSLVTDDIHAWVGRDAAREAGVPVSRYPLTDEERRLRDFAYPFIEPPFDRARWYSVVNEYGVTHALDPAWPHYDVASYSVRIMERHYRSATARYNQLNTDIRNDVERIPDFFATARRVLDLDRKRAQSLAFVDALTREEALNAKARMAENELVIAWAQFSMSVRAASYCYALQRLVIATPAPMAVEVERSLTLLQARITQNLIPVGPQFGPPPAGCGAPVVVAAPPRPGIITK
jgi:hypothetical protein